jgi:hypothetical protein
MSRCRMKRHSVKRQVGIASTSLLALVSIFMFSIGNCEALGLRVEDATELGPSTCAIRVRVKDVAKEENLLLAALGSHLLDGSVEAWIGHTRARIARFDPANGYRVGSLAKRQDRRQHDIRPLDEVRRCVTFYDLSIGLAYVGNDVLKFGSFRNGRADQMIGSEVKRHPANYQPWSVSGVKFFSGEIDGDFQFDRLFVGGLPKLCSGTPQKDCGDDEAPRKKSDEKVGNFEPVTTYNPGLSGLSIAIIGIVGSLFLGRLSLSWIDGGRRDNRRRLLGWLGIVLCICLVFSGTVGLLFGWDVRGLLGGLL